MITINIGKYSIKEYFSISLDVIKNIVFVRVKRYNHHKWINKYSSLISLKL
jgi:hypothetical protein